PPPLSSGFRRGDSQPSEYKYHFSAWRLLQEWLVCPYGGKNTRERGRVKGKKIFFCMTQNRLDKRGESFGQEKNEKQNKKKSPPAGRKGRGRQFPFQISLFRKIATPSRATMIEAVMKINPIALKNGSSPATRAARIEPENKRR